MLACGLRPFCAGTARGNSIWVSILRVRSETEKPVLLGKAVSPVVFRDFLARLVLAVAGLHGVDFGHGGLPLGGVARAVFFDEVADDVRTFQNDAAAGGLGGGF